MCCFCRPTGLNILEKINTFKEIWTLYMATTVTNLCVRKSQWPFEDSKLEVPTIYKAYVRPMQDMKGNLATRYGLIMVQSLHFRIMKGPLKISPHFKMCRRVLSPNSFLFVSRQGDTPFDYLHLLISVSNEAW